MKKWMISLVLLVSAVLALGVKDGEMVALGPAPYLAGAVEYETYLPEPDVVRPGEAAEYVASWNGIPAAWATIEVHQDPKRPDWICAGGEGHIAGQVSLLYEAKDSVSSCMKADTFKPDTYSIQIHETLDYYDMVVNFNHDNLTAHRTRVRPKKDDSIKDFKFKNAYCPVSLILLVRSLPWKTGDVRRFEVIDGNDRYLMVVEGKETADIKVPAGTFHCIRLEPSIFELPSDKKWEDARWWEKQKRKDEERMSLIKSFELWMATDGARPFVKGRADLYFGHVDLELKSLKAPDLNG